jgi:hypothetical protein
MNAEESAIPRQSDIFLLYWLAPESPHPPQRSSRRTRALPSAREVTAFDYALGWVVCHEPFILQENGSRVWDPVTRFLAYATFAGFYTER